MADPNPFDGLASADLIEELELRGDMPECEEEHCYGACEAAEEGVNGLGEGEALRLYEYLRDQQNVPNDIREIIYFASGRTLP